MHPSTLIAGVTLALAATLPAAAHEVIYVADLTGPAEAPPNASAGTGKATVTFDFDLVTMHVDVSFSGLAGSTTASHIHCCTAAPGVGTAGVATTVPSFPLFPVGVTSGHYDHTFDMTDAGSYNPTFITANGGTVGTAFAALAAGLDAGKAYLNVHTSMFPGGEIRGFLAPVPEPGTDALMLLGLAGVGAAAWRKRARAG